MLFLPGLVPTSSRTQTFGCNKGAKALKNHYGMIINITGNFGEADTSLAYPVAINLFLILFFQTKENLGGNDTLVGIFEIEIWIESERGGILEKMSGDFFIVDHVFHVVSWLVHTQ
jgi:hypothetical protein